MNLDGNNLEAMIYRHAATLRPQLDAAIPARNRSVLSADDVLQYAMVAAIRGFSRFRGTSDAAFAAWFRTIATNDLRDAIASLEIRQPGRRIEPESDQTSLAESVFGADTGTPSRAVAASELNAALRGAMDRLPPHYREVVTAYDLDHEPVESIAARIGCSPGAVYLRRRRALEELRAWLAEAGFRSDGR